MMNIGYACRALAVPGSEIKGCMAKNASEERILQLIGQNLAAFKKMVEYNIENGIRLFRISSDIIPFGSSLAANIPWEKLYADRLLEISRLITGAGMRVSMHPGQYTVLNSPSVSVVE
ncbi:MAG TPA: hypothetical protein PLU43_04935, partial [Lachnospiraceae bacterium]|nr:hypothetical protein [Lachnospiraceae bacterium]